MRLANPVNIQIRATAVALAAAILAAAAARAAAAQPETAPAGGRPAVGAPAAAQEADAPPGGTLTGNWFGAGDRLAERGLTLKLSATQVYQDLARGGGFTHRHAGRYTGTYDFEAEADLEKLARVPGASLYILTEGGWSQGIEGRAIATLFGVNADAIGNQSARVVEFHYNQTFFDDRLRLRLGKIDLTGGFECRGCPVAFDGNAFANDETAQFLSAALVNNPTIPFPQRGLGAVVLVQPADSCYVSAGVADAKARDGETGFNTAFEDPHETLSLYETGYLAGWPSARGPLRGAYRLGMWYDTAPKDRFDGAGVRRGDTGLYVSMDQVLLREKGDPADEQGLGAFARFGFADAAVNPVKCFWSTGCQYRGLLPGRDADVLAVGAAQGRLACDPGAGFTARHETVIETYYGIEVAPWLTVSPHVQYVVNPGGQKEMRDAVIVGVRIQAAF